MRCTAIWRQRWKKFRKMKFKNEKAAMGCGKKKDLEKRFFLRPNLYDELQVGMFGKDSI